MDPKIKEVVGTIEAPPGLEKFNEPFASISDIITIVIRGFFIVAGVVMIYFLFWGAFDWITSGGDKEKISKAQQRITNALWGFFLFFVILGIVWVLENLVFGQRFCFGLTCPIKIPQF